MRCILRKLRSLDSLTRGAGSTPAPVDDMDMDSLRDWVVSGGLELVRNLDARNYEAPVLVLSGYPLDAGWENVWGKNVVDCVIKPIGMERLGSALKKGLSGVKTAGGPQSAK